MNNAPSLAPSAVLLSCAVLAISPVGAATLEIFPSSADSSCSEEFENLANGLKPGDVLILHGGTYTQTCRRAITLTGTPASPITIRAADGETPIVTRPEPANFSYDQNNIEIVNSSYLVIRGLHFKGGDGGVSFIGGHHITFEDTVVSGGANAVDTFKTKNFTLSDVTNLARPAERPHVGGDGLSIGMVFRAGIRFLLSPGR